MRVQVKVAARRQLWQLEKNRAQKFDLGWRRTKALPAYFKRDFGGERQPIYGNIEEGGYRCDLFLLAWHPDPTPEQGRPQSDPEAYQYYIVPVRDLQRLRRLPKSLGADVVSAQYRCWNLSEIALALNETADGFLKEQAEGGVKVPRP